MSDANQLPHRAQTLSVEPRWWRSVRFRFGLLLALALLPWLILTGRDAIDERDRNRMSEARLADIVAMSTVDEIGRTLEAGRLSLEAAPQLITEQGCASGAAEILDRLRVFTALIIKNADEEVVCQSPPSLTSLVLIGPDPFDNSHPFRIEKGELTRDVQAEPVVVLQRYFASTRRTYTLVMPETLGLRSVLDATMGAESYAALTKPSGRGIVGIDTATSDSQWFQQQTTADEISLIDYVSADGEERRLAARYFPYLDLYVGVGRNVEREQTLGFINPYVTFLLPILAWLIGFGLIWLGTQSMLLTPISKIRRASARVASGQLDRRVDLSDAAATEVQALGSSFNRMAGQLEERANRIADNLDEKDTLMREIHHRVKNNLQIIISLLNMQERKAETEEAVAAIAETRARINAISIVHRGLYESDDLREIDLQPFVSRLISSLSESMGTEEGGIRLNQTVEPCGVGADDAIPVALFIVEAISNAVKHGVERGGKISVDIRHIAEDRLQIDVQDDGRGVGDMAQMRGIGTRLMNGFARQLSGTLEFRDGSPGMTVRLIMPLRVPEDKSFQVSRKRN